jgi:hypothetical protein
MMAIVMDLHGAGIDVRFKRVVGIGKRVKFERADGAWAWTSRTNATAATAAEPAMNFRRVKDAMGSNDMGFPPMDYVFSVLERACRSAMPAGTIAHAA